MQAMAVLAVTRVRVVMVARAPLALRAQLMAPRAVTVALQVRRVWVALGAQVLPVWVLPVRLVARLMAVRAVMVVTG
jgi:hypothetical protein